MSTEPATRPEQLPAPGPITGADVDDTVVLGFAGIRWLVSARNWFTGPEESRA